MAKEAELGGAHRRAPWRIAGWSIALLLLLLPLAAMRFTDEVRWTGSDFLFAAVLIGGTGLLFELAVRMSRDPFYRAGVGAALAASFLIVWATGAVGMIGDEGDPHNLLFLAIVPLALVGGAVASFRAAGMAGAMLVAGVAHLAVAAAGLPADPLGAVFSAAMAGPWLLAAWLFRKAASNATA